MKAEHRKRRILLAVKTSLLAKGATMFLQLAVMPLAIRRLGLDLYAVYSIVTSFLFLIYISEFGIGPRLIRTLSVAETRGDRKEQQVAFSTAFLLVASVGLAAAILLSIASQVVPATWIAGPTQHVYVSTIRQCVPVVCLLGLVQLLANVVQRAQAGFQELHIYNLVGGLGNVLMSLGILIFLWLPTSVLSLILCLYGSQSLALVGNMVGFFWRRPWIVPKLSFVDLAKVRSFLNEGIQVSLNQSIVPWIQREFTKILLFGLAGAAVAAQFSICVQLTTFMSGVIVMLTAPLLGAISDAVSHHDLRWIKSSLRRLLATTLAYTIALLIIFPAFGPHLIVSWLGPQAQFTPDQLFVLVIYFGIAAFKQILYVFIVSIRFEGLITVMSLAEVTLGLLLISNYGQLGLTFTLWVLALLNIPSALVAFPLLFQRAFRDCLVMKPV